MISISEYARNNNISYQAIKKQVDKMAAGELDGHVSKVGRTWFLDDNAVKVLDQHRSPSIVIEREDRAEIERLKGELKLLKDLFRESEQARAELMEIKGRYAELLEYRDIEDRHAREIEEDLINIRSEYFTTKEKLNQTKEQAEGLKEELAELQSVHASTMIERDNLQEVADNLGERVERLKTADKELKKFKKAGGLLGLLGLYKRVEEPEQAEQEAEELDYAE